MCSLELKQLVDSFRVKVNSLILFLFSRSLSHLDEYKEYVAQGTSQVAYIIN